MCPGTLAIASAATAAAGSAFSGLSSGGAANYQAQVAHNNAVVASMAAMRAGQATATNTEVAGLQARQQSAGVRTGSAANNIAVGTGSAAGLQESQRDFGRFQQATASARGTTQTYGYEMEATSQAGQARLDNLEAGGDVVGGFMGAAEKGLGAAADLPSGGGDSGGGNYAGPDLPSGGGGYGAPEPSLLSGPPTVSGPYAYFGGNPTMEPEELLG